MEAVLTFVDEHFGGGGAGRSQPVTLKLMADRVSVRDIIRRRVADEVEALNTRKADDAAVLVRTRSFLIPLGRDSAEAQLNRPIARRRSVELIDLEKEYERALEAFEKRRFLMLIDDRQIDSLDEEVSVTKTRELTFLHLTPLQGG